MLARLIVIATLVTAPCACAGLLDLDPGTLRDATEAGPDSGDLPPDANPPDAAPRGCKAATGSGIYCDDFDDPGRTDPNAREAKAADEVKDSLSLTEQFSFSPKRSLEAKYLNTGFPRALLTLPWKMENASFHMTLAVRVARDGISVGDAFTIGQILEAPGRNGVDYSIQLTPRQEAIEVRLKNSSTVLAFHDRAIPYDEWHEVSMRFQGRYVYLGIDGDSVSEGAAELTGDWTASFGLAAFAPATVYLDNVEIGP